MSANALMLLQLVIFGMLCGVTFLLVWSLAGFVAEKPEKAERDIREAVEKLTAAERRVPKPMGRKKEDESVAA